MLLLLSLTSDLRFDFYFHQGALLYSNLKLNKIYYAKVALVGGEGGTLTMAREWSGARERSLVGGIGVY